MWEGWFTGSEQSGRGRSDPVQYRKDNCGNEEAALPNKTVPGYTKSSAPHKMKWKPNHMGGLPPKPSNH